jgi:hypothetical protein
VGFYIFGVLVGIICQHFGIDFVWLCRMDAKIFFEACKGCVVAVSVWHEQYAFFDVVRLVGAYKHHDAA